MNNIKQRERRGPECNDLFSRRSGNKIHQGNRYSNDTSCKGLERSGNLLFKCCNSPATVRRSINGKFLSVDEIFITDVNKEIANTVLARYWKGIEANNSNCVIEIIETE